MFDVEKAAQLQSGIVETVSRGIPQIEGRDAPKVLKLGAVLLVAKISRKSYQKFDAALMRYLAEMAEQDKAFSIRREVSSGIATTSALLRLEDFVIGVWQLWQMDRMKWTFMTQVYHPNFEECDPIWLRDTLRREEAAKMYHEISKTQLQGSLADVAAEGLAKSEAARRENSDSDERTHPKV